MQVLGSTRRTWNFKPGPAERRFGGYADHHVRAVRPALRFMERQDTKPTLGLDLVVPDTAMTEH